MGLDRSRGILAAALIAALLGGCGAAASAPSPSTPVASPPTGSPQVPSASALPSPMDPDDEAGDAPTGATEAPTSSGSANASVAPAAERLAGEPDPSLTPGALNPAVTQATIGSTICVSGWTTTVRPPSSYTTTLKIQQIEAYGYTDTTLASYEEDHLIPLQLGGAPADPRNLWPEPYAASLADGRPTGARVKDAFETSLKREVCSGAISLADAQARIGIHWVHAYYGIALDVPPAGSAPAPTAAAPAPASPTVAPPVAGSWSGVTFLSLTSPVSPGARATASARTTAAASCSIVVVYSSGPSHAQGLVPKSADGTGVVSWTWTVGSATKAGTWPVTITCRSGGHTASARASLVVL